MQTLHQSSATPHLPSVKEMHRTDENGTSNHEMIKDKLVSNNTNNNTTINNETVINDETIIDNPVRNEARNNKMSKNR